MDIKSLLDIPPWNWPKEAETIVLKALTDMGNESNRLIATELAGELVVMNDELAEILLEIVRSPDEPEKLRGRAAISLGPVLEQADTEFLEGEGFEDPEAVPITEQTFHNVQASLHRLCLDSNVPPEVRRKILEASVRSPQDWHRDAIQAAYSSNDRDWRLTAVFAMRWVRGFDDQILEALKSTDLDIHYEAVKAAGVWELDGAWSRALALVRDPATPKPLRLAAIEAVGNIRPREAGEILAALAGSPDKEIAEAAEEAIGMAAALSGDFEEENNPDETKWIN